VAYERGDAYSQTMAVPAYPADAEPTGLGFERCTITRWRGYVTSSFVAVLEDGNSGRGVGPPSAPAARTIPPDAKPARGAFAELRAELERQGWDASTDEADPWYEARFTRPAAAPGTSGAGRRPPPLAPPASSAPACSAPACSAPARSAAAGPARPAPPRVEPPVVAEPRIELPELPPAAHTASGSSRPSRLIVVVSTLGIAAALALGAYLELGPSGAARCSPAHDAGLRSDAAKGFSSPGEGEAAAAAGSHAGGAPKAATVRVDISAPTRASWLEIRSGSASGPVLFSGELAPGRQLNLTGARLWARFALRANLAIRANGRPVKFIGTYEHVFVPTKK